MTSAHRVGPSETLVEGGRLVVDIGEHTIGIFRVHGRLYAYQNTCPHQGGPVCQGTMLPGVVEVIGDTQTSAGFQFNDADPRIVCPWHGYEFRITTGCHPGRASIRLRSVPVFEEEGVIHVSL
jgi:nitrite reductase/ring-hydroxylating ferredoxin subunit